MNIEEAIQQWHKRIDAVRTQVKSEFGELSSKRLNWKPSSENWSIAEVLGHLILVNNHTRWYWPMQSSEHQIEGSRPKFNSSSKC